MKRSYNVVFAGSPEFALPCLEVIQKSSQMNLLWTYTQPDRRSGRGMQTQSPPVKQWCVQNGVRCLQPEKLGSYEANQLRQSEVDFLLVAAYGQIIPSQVLDAVRIESLNVHGSLLPRWRGASPVSAAILAGDCRVGYSIMRVQKGLDTGGVYAQGSIEQDGRSCGQLTEWIAIEGASRLKEVVENFDSYKKKFQEQDSSRVTYAPKIEKSQALIPWKQSAIEVARHIRAYNPNPMAFSFLGESRVKILKASVAYQGYNVTKHYLSGTILEVGPKGLLVGCGEHTALWVTQLQYPGKKAVFITEHFKRWSCVQGLCFDDNAS